MIYGMGLSAGELAGMREHERRVNDHYARGLGAADLATLDMDRTQLVQPGGGGGGSMAVRMAIIDAYTTGAFGAANSGFSCRYLDSNGNGTGSAFGVYIWSYSDPIGEYGRVNIANSNADPDWRVGDRIPVMEMEYAGQTRPCLLFAVREKC
ncbi:MAG: hypothetical protein JNG88_16150 [Phycisphaerales bacterium]|nr:hypothetical protein [Phycisphaerales bacterium]